MFNVEDPIVYYKTSEKMEEVDDNSIQLIITSPPYGKIKDYGSEEQIGFSDSFTEYFERLKQVWKECFRVLESQCRLVINVGDQYLRTSDYGRYRILSIASQIIRDCLDLGFDYLGDIIWQKVSTTNTTGGCSLMGSIYYPRNGLLTYDYEHVLIFKKIGKNDGKKVDLQRKELSKISLSEWKKWYVGHWRFPGIIQKEHVAMFPDELPYRLIRMFSFIGDTILDPFTGSGSTLKVAKALYRKSIGYELNKNFQSTIENKINEADISYFKDYQYLIYSIFKKSKIENFSINYEKQKQKGIIVISDDNTVEIIIDYMLLGNEINNDEMLRKELKLKLNENTIQNYLKGKVKWENFAKYIIIINHNLPKDVNLDEEVEIFLKKFGSGKKIQFIKFTDIISDDFSISNLFL